MEEKALIIVPHQDDETYLAGNIIDVIKSQYDLFIFYSSLDADPKRGTVRKQEAIAACGVWGITEDHLAFLDYPDTANSHGHHYYTDGNHEIIDALRRYIFELKPSIIFATDFDYHSDHRMLSLAFDTAMGRLLKESKNYHPTVLKGFCYETAFYSAEDYKASCPGDSVSNIDPLSNPSYEWNKRISIKSFEKAGPIWTRKAYKALKKHRSQYAVLHARSIVNQDNVFWLRRTDNLLLSANISSAVDNVEKIRDYIILDTDDIITTDPRKIDYSKACCDLREGDWIKAEWDEPIKFDRIVIHGSINNDKEVQAGIRIIADDAVIENLELIRAYGRDTELVLKPLFCKKITFEIVSGSASISEIEVLNGQNSVDVQKRWVASNELKPKCKFIDAIDAIGYKWIIFATRLRRKLTNTFLG